MTQIPSSVFHSGSPEDLSSYFGLPVLPLGLAVDIFQTTRKFSLHLTHQILKLALFSRTLKLIQDLFLFWLVFLYVQFLIDPRLVL